MSLKARSANPQRYPAALKKKEAAVPVPSPTPSPLPPLSDAFLRAHPDAVQGGRFAADLYAALQHRLPLTFFQEAFLFAVAAVPLPYSWKLAVFSYLYDLNTFPVGLALAGAVLLLVLLRLARALFSRRLAAREPKAFLELTPPPDSGRTAYATEQLFAFLHSLAGQRGLGRRLLGTAKRYSLEIAATREGGIRYLLVCSKPDAEIVRKGLLSFLPGIRIEEAADYLAGLPARPSGGRRGIVELRLSGHFALPLQAQKSLDEHDPIAYLAGNMTKLQEGELLAFQAVVTPLGSSGNRFAKRQVRRLKARIARRLPLADELASSPLEQGAVRALRTATALAQLLADFLRFVVTALVDLLVPGPRPVAVAVQPPPVPPEQLFNAYEQELQAGVKEKVDRPLFSASLRFLAVTGSGGEYALRTAGFLSSLGPLASARQSLVPAMAFSKRLRSQSFAARLPSPGRPPVLSSSELADLYHFPFDGGARTEGLATVRSPELPVPLSQKRGARRLDVVIGTNTYGGERVPVGLTPEQRRQHTYIVGKTGMGKSTIIEGMALQDMQSGKGLAVIDPHGDVVRRLLALVPERRRDDVVYVNPADKEFPVGLNILNPGIEFSDPEERHEWLTGSLMSVLMKITPKDKWGQRMEHILRNATLTALAAPVSRDNPHVSLFTIQKLLTDKAYRKSVAVTLKDPVLRQFWLKEFALFGSMQQADAISPLTNKLGEFLTSPLSRRILLQEKTTVNIPGIMDGGRILLVNLSKGELGEERSAFFGTLLVSLIQLATYARARQPEEERRDFFAYVDEFQNFATPHFADLFSESRKFHVFFTPTHQSVAQIDDPRTASVISGNAGTLVALRSGPDDEAFLLPFLRPEVERGAIVNLAPHRFLMKVAHGESEDGFSGETIPVKQEGSEEVAEEIVDASRERYATPRKAVEERLEQLLGGTAGTPKELSRGKPKPVSAAEKRSAKPEKPSGAGRKRTAE